MKKKKILFSILLTFSFLLYGESWRRGIELENDSDMSAALHFYEGWLKENPADGDFKLVFDRFFSIQPDLNSFMENAGKEWGIDSKQRAELERSAAVLLELGGDIETAVKWFMKSYESYPVLENIENLIDVAELNLRMGRYSEAEKIVEFIKEQDISETFSERTDIIKSRCEFQMGNTDEAVSMTLELLEKAEKKSVELLLWGKEIFEAAGEIAAAESIINDLEKNFPEVFEQLKPGGGWNIADIPEKIFGFSDNRNNSREIPDETADSEEILKTEVRIQTGSYRDPENALEQVKDLEEAGFDAEIKVVEINGSKYNRVMVVGINEANLEEENVRLKEAGFEGFPVY